MVRVIPPPPSPPALSSQVTYIHNLACDNPPGHEDGKVKVWLSRCSELRLLTALDTARYFVAEDLDDRSESPGDWPPFRRVGSFDPFSDDPR